MEDAEWELIEMEQEEFSSETPCQAGVEEADGSDSGTRREDWEVDEGSVQTRLLCEKGCECDGQTVE